MSSLGFSISGIECIEKIKEEINQSFSRERLYRIFAIAVEKAYKKAYDLCPRDTGWMQGQLKIDGSGENWSLICNCDYAVHNEYGWSGIPPVPKPPAMVHYKGGYRPFMRIGALHGEKYFHRAVMREAQKLNQNAK